MLEWEKREYEMREIETESNLSLYRHAAQEEATDFILGELPASYVAKTLNRRLRPSRV